MWHYFFGHTILGIVYLKTVLEPGGQNDSVTIKTPMNIFSRLNNTWNEINFASRNITNEGNAEKKIRYTIFKYINKNF